MRHPERLLCFAFLAVLGCQSDRPKPLPAEEAMNTVNTQIGYHCPAKKVSAEEFNEFAKDYYKDADVQSQQLIVQQTTASCKANSSEPECYNAGFSQAEIQMGGMDEIVKQICNKK
jgi:hypothetical protein